MKRKLIMVVITGVALMTCSELFAASSANYKINQSVINSAGNTYAGASMQAYDSVGEALCGQTYGDIYSFQAGFFNDYFMPAPTPTQTTTTGIPFLNREIKAYNNQINPEKGEYTTIRWSQPSDAKTTIRIYNLLGELVKTLVHKIYYVQGQTHEIRWSGINGAGNAVGSGIYIAHIKAGSWQDRVKIAVVK